MFDVIWKNDMKQIWDTPSYPPSLIILLGNPGTRHGVFSSDIRRTEKFSSTPGLIIATCIKFQISILLVNLILKVLCYIQ